MGKYVVWFVIIVIALLAVEWLGIIDIPYLDLPDFTGGKQDLIHKTTEVTE